MPRSRRPNAQPQGSLATPPPCSTNGCAGRFHADNAGRVPLVDDQARWKELYLEAQGARLAFDSALILADLSGQMLLHTDRPFGSSLPKLPRPSGTAAVPLVIRTGKPAVGDVFMGPLARRPLFAVAVPVRRLGKIEFTLLTAIDVQRIQSAVDRVNLPTGAVLSVFDSKGELVARQVGPDASPDPVVDPEGRITTPMSLAPWSVVLQIPRDVMLGPETRAGWTLAAFIILATGAGLLGGTVVSRRLASSVATLTEPEAARAMHFDIAEVARSARLWTPQCTSVTQPCARSRNEKPTSARCSTGCPMPWSSPIRIV